MIHIPEEHQMRQQILTLPEYNINIALGTDYMGEDKKGFLRQAMYSADLQGMLGLHAGPSLTVLDARPGNCAATASSFRNDRHQESTWSCRIRPGPHQGEGGVNQDDIVFLCRDGSALGTEHGFYVKTDIMPDQQEAMYQALIDRTALLEIADGHRQGESTSGRGPLRQRPGHRDKLKVKRDGRLIGISADSVNYRR
jgi:phosphoenolpyruvate carboxykinase (ATP)